MWLLNNFHLTSHKIDLSDERHHLLLLWVFFISCLIVSSSIADLILKIRTFLNRFKTWN